MDLSAYYDDDGDVRMDGPRHADPSFDPSTGGAEESKGDPSVPSRRDPLALPPGETPGAEVVDYRRMRAEARKRRYPDYFKGRSDPAGDHGRERDEKGDDRCFFVPTRLAAKPEVDMSSRLTVKMDKETKAIVDALAADNGKAFAAFLKKPPAAKKAVQRLLRMKLPTFYQVRILALWHLLKKSHAANVDVPPDDREVVADYLAEVHEVLGFSFLAQTRKRLMVTLDEPSWLWLDFFKRLWVPEMGQDLKDQIRAVGSRRVFEAITPLIREYHATHKPFRRFSSASRSAFPSSSATRETEIEIPSLWYRSIFYPLLGGEPRGLFDDTPMSFQETLATMIS